MRARFAELTTSLMNEDPRVAVVLADISETLFDQARKAHPNRVISLGIREQLLISVTAGLSLAGMRPIGHTYAPFLIERPFEQIKLDLSHQDVGAILVSIGSSYDAVREGRTHQAPEDVSLMSTLPGWAIHVPGHPDEMDALLRSAVTTDDRVYLRLTERHNARAVPGDGVRMIRRGSHGTVIAVGPMLDAVIAAAEGLDVTVLYATTVRPFDAAVLVQSLGVPDVIVVEPYLAGTSAWQVGDALAHLPHRIRSLGVAPIEARRYGSPEEHDALHGLDPAGLRSSFTSFLTDAA